MNTRKIIHLDLDAFFCSVEEINNPMLKGQVFVVGGSPQGRGVVASSSYAARFYGIHSAMPLKTALSKFPNLLCINGHYDVYREKSEKVMQLLGQYTPLVEQISIDEAYLDITDLREPIRKIAEMIQMQLLKELKLPSSLGGATNKLIAKIANNIGKKSIKTKSAPLSINIIEPGEERKFLAPLPVNEMWGIGEKTSERLNKMGIFKIGDIPLYPSEKFDNQFGNYSQVMRIRSLGIDDSPVINFGVVKSISNEITFSSDISEEQYLRKTIWNLSSKVASRLRYKSLMGGTVRIKIRWPNFQTYTRQIALSSPTHNDSIIFKTAFTLFKNNWRGNQPIRLIGVGVSQLCNSIQQFKLYENQEIKEEKLMLAIDELNMRFGECTVIRADRISAKNNHD